MIIFLWLRLGTQQISVWVLVTMCLHDPDVLYRLSLAFSPGSRPDMTPERGSSRLWRRDDKGPQSDFGVGKKKKK